MRSTQKDFSSRQVATSLFKALDVLSVVAINPDGVDMAELQQALPIPRTSILRILQSLEVYGLIQREARRWRVTARFHVWTVPNLFEEMRSRYRPVLEKLSKLLKELVVLGIVEGGRLRHIDYVEWEHQVVVRAGLARRFPLTQSAMGKLFLTQRPDLWARISDPRLREEIDEARRTGVGWNREGTATGIIAVACWAGEPSPLSPMISVSWPKFRFKPASAEQAVQAIQKAVGAVRSEG